MMRSMISLIRRNRPAISLIMLLIITGSLASIYWALPITSILSAVVFGAAFSMMTFGFIGLSTVVKTWLWLEERPNEALQKLNELNQALKEYNETLDRILDDKKMFDLRFSDLQTRVNHLEAYLKQSKQKRLLVNNINQDAPSSSEDKDYDIPNPHRLFTKRLSPEQRVTCESNRNQDAASEIDRLYGSYPRLNKENQRDASYIRMLNRALSEHHEVVKAIMHPYLDEFTEKVISVEQIARKVSQLEK